MIRRRFLALFVALALAPACSGGDESVETEPPTRKRSTTSESTTPPTQPSTTTSVVSESQVPVAASTPQGLADQMVAAERAVRDPTQPPEALAAMGHLEQVAYRALARRPEWDDAVFAAVPDDLRPIIVANTTATRELTMLVRKPRETLPAWRIVPLAPAHELQGYYQQAEAEFGVPWQYLAAVHLVESRMGRLRGTSTAGAQGPMQFLPSTWEAYGEGDIHDNLDAIRAAARYLKANGAPERMDNALYRYNPTPHYVNAVTIYAEEMRRDARAYFGYYHWQVYYWTIKGDLLLPVGYAQDHETPVT